jgi:hypothetical protein
VLLHCGLVFRMTMSGFEPGAVIGRRWRWAAGGVGASLVCSGSAFVALLLGWHPFPSTAVGCALHKKFHSFHAPIEPQRIIANTNCITVTLRGRGGVIRDVERIHELRSWLAARDELWEENLVTLFDPPGPPLLIIRSCNARDDRDEYVYASEDWLGFVPGKSLMRPICRGEWREIVALVDSDRAARRD